MECSRRDYQSLAQYQFAKERAEWALGRPSNLLRITELLRGSEELILLV
jgi:hypothetical protein